MKPCPTCGVMLTASLADAVRNPAREESCPKASVPESQDDGLSAAQNRLAALMLLGHMWEARA